MERWGRGELFVRKEVTPEKWDKILQNPGREAMLAERREALQKWDAMDEADRRHAPLKNLLAPDIAERVFAGYVAGKARSGDGPQPERFVVQPAWLRRGDCAAEAEHIVESILRSA